MRLRPPATVAAMALGLALFLAGCAHHFALPAGAPRAVIRGEGGGSLADRFAPAFLVYGADDPANLVGEPVAREEKGGKAEVLVDPARPTVYFLEQEFCTEKGRYRNLAYRVHFPEIPFSLVPFHLTAGKNPGLLVVVTLDERDRPVLVTTVHTCGCYKAILPTDLLPFESLPEDWKLKPRKNIYGETLPAVVPMGLVQDPVLVARLRPGVHRVMDLWVVPRSELARLSPSAPVAAPLVPMDRLEHIPLAQGETSLYHGSGFMEGFVKGSVKPWETLLMSWMALDPLVGTDKRFPAGPENPFYTSLKPWRRHASDMSDFPTFLSYWGWRL